MPDAYGKTLLLGWHAGNIGCAHTPRAANEGLVERDKDRAGRTAAQVHRGSEFNSLHRKRKRGCDGRFILGVNVFEAEQPGECITDGALLKSVQTPQDPACFEQYRFGDPNWPGREQRPCGGGLFEIVPGQQPDQYVTLVSTAIMAPNHLASNGRAHLRQRF